MIVMKQTTVENGPHMRLLLVNLREKHCRKCGVRACANSDGHEIYGTRGLTDINSNSGDFEELVHQISTN